jgi:hypothetical protein
VGSNTINMVGGGGINSPHPPTSRYQNLAAHGRTGQSGAPLVRQQCTNGNLQWLVLTASRWAEGTPDSEQSLSGAHRTVNSHCPVHTGQSGVPAIIQFSNSALLGF